MRKCILLILILSGIAAARDPVDAERAALRKKLTRLAKVKKRLGVPQPQPALAMTPAIDKAASNDLKPVAEGKKAPAEPVAQQRAADPIIAVGSPAPVPQAAVAGRANPAPTVAVGTDVVPAHEVIYPVNDFQGVNRNQEVSLGEIARRYRAQKRQQSSSRH